MPNAARLAHKNRYCDRLRQHLRDCPEAILATWTGVSSRQMMDMRAKFRNRAVIICGKNTLMKKAFSMEEDPEWRAKAANAAAGLSGNVSYVFVMPGNDVEEVINEVESFKRVGAAKAGQTSLVDYTLAAGPTGMDPSQTSFFQALNIGTKVVKGQIEVSTEKKILIEGTKVSASAAVLMQKLGVQPFEYSPKVTHVYQDGFLLPIAIFNTSPAAMQAKFQGVVSKFVSPFALGVGIPTSVTVPVAMRIALKHAVSLVLDDDALAEQIEEAKPFKDYLENPDAFAVADAGPAVAAAAEAPKEEAKAAVVEEEEEEDEDMGFDLFD